MSDAQAGRAQPACPPMGPGGRWAIGGHLLFYGTLAAATALALDGPGLDPARTGLGVGLAALLGLWYAHWVVRRGEALTASRARALTYFGVAGLAWAALVVVDPAYEMLGVTALVQILGYLPWRAVLPAALAAAVLGHLPAALREGPGSGEALVGHAVWTAVGLALLALVVVSVRTIVEQSGRRQRLIEALQATREELARAERRAGVLEERQRLAGEIHDTLAQAFTSIVMLLEAAEASTRSSPTAAADHLAHARDVARDGLREARRLVWALRPEALERGTLADALARMTDALARQTGMTARTVVTGEPQRLPTEVEVTLMRAAQEALANVRRHARAGRVTVTLSYMDDLVVLDVRDDGVGFEASARPAAPERQGGLGLVVMRERAEALGGTLTIESAPGEGTSLVLALPLGPRAGEGAPGAREALAS